MFQNLLVYLTHPHVEAWNFNASHCAKINNWFPGVNIKVAFHSKEFLAELPSVEAVMVWHFKKDWLALAPNLRDIFTPAAGRDWVEVTTDERVRVHFGGFHGPPMAEAVVGAAIYFYRAFGLSRHLQAQRKWGRVKVSQAMRGLRGSRATIVGFGRIGREIGRRLKFMGCAITGVRKRAIPDRPDFFSETDRVLPVDRLEEALSETDHLVLALPGEPETDGLISRRHFDLLPTGCYLYNVGRGNACREADLVSALESGRLAGAYLDVFEKEPLDAESPLWGFDQVLIQPHLSAAIPEYLDLYLEEWRRLREA